MTGFHQWVSPREKSEGKGQCKKVKLSCLSMKENKATGKRSTFLALFFGALGIFWSYWVSAIFLN